MKYFDVIRKAQAAQKPVAELPPFDLERMRGKGFAAAAVSWMLDHPHWWLAALRRFRPVLQFRGFALVTRNADVREVLERQDVFHTPFGPEMQEMGGGANFILGMQDSSDYRRQKSSILSAFPIGEIETVLRPLAARHASEIMRGAKPGFNVAADLLKVVPVRICRDYFGVLIDDEVEFADWSIALSAFFFSDFMGSPTARELAVVAADRMTRVIERSIDAHLEGRLAAATPLARLVAIHKADPVSLPRADILSIMMGMISGFVPTDLLAAGNALDVILSKREAQNAVEEAAAAGDDKLLDKAILEAMRFKPIYLGPSRYVARDAVIAEGTRRRKEIKAGTVVLASTLSAMFDPAAVADASTYDPSRPARDYLVFGHGIHWCIGSAIARVEIAESFRALFAKHNVRRAPGKAGRLVRLGAYPEKLHVVFDRPADCQTVENSLVTIVAPLAEGADRETVRASLAALGNPAGEAMRGALDQAGVIHFASIAIVEPEETPEPGRTSDASPGNGHIVIELSGDGDPRAVIDAVAAHAGTLLRPVLETAAGLSPEAPLAPFLAGRAIRSAPGFLAHAGLGFCGTPGHSVKRIKREAALESDISDILKSRKDDAPGDATAIIADVRDKLIQSERQDWAFQPAESNLEKPPGSVKALLAATLLKPAPAVFTALVLAFWTWVNFTHVLEGPRPGLIQNLLLLGLSFGLTIFGIALVAAVLLGILLVAIRQVERKDVPSTATIGMDRYRAIAERENRAVQNNLTAVSILKPGLLRRLALRAGLLAVSLFARFVFKPGELSDIGTIHYARWIVLPGTRQLLFFSNYGGSWESYLEDFITKATKGLTGVWSNTIGYPKTRFLFLDGAADGDRFKRWARLQQLPTLFWYSAYPTLDTARIRINSSIRQGLVNVRSEAEARAWLDHFGSIPRPANVLETDEIQSIFFGPLGPLEHAEFVAVSVPDGLAKPARRLWLSHILSKASFGDRLPEKDALIVAFGPKGLERLGLDGDQDYRPVSSFPVAFQQGMDDPARARILDDLGDSDPAGWAWGSGEKTADAVVACYGVDDVTLAALVGGVEAATAAAGCHVVARAPMVIRREKKAAAERYAASGPGGKPGENPKGFAVEHFGFADGLSQPIIEGTPRSHMRADAQHVIAAGEFLFGYRDQRGYLPPSPEVEAAYDTGGLLSRLDDAEGENTTATAQRMRDFGRNGSFLVVRQLQQHVERFDEFCAAAAEKLKPRLPEEAVTPEWVGAKMVGRWKDGSSLVRNPHGRPSRSPDNSFTFGDEDPQGTRCPLGAHIRRSNPRDSLGDDHERQIELGKRHRILRVGRTYEMPAGDNDVGKDAEKGLLFMCLNADIERQYEFIQQTWVGSGLFHGLRFEKDPLIGTQNGGAGFTIPSVRGGVTLTGLPNFVTTKGGGYFFMPGKRALRYMLSRL